MSYKDHFPSRYIKVDDLKGRKAAVTIASVPCEDVGQEKKSKLVVYFKETKKGLPLNRINGDTIAEITGTDDEQDWIGHRIILVPSRTEFQGKRVPCIRVEPPGEAAPPAADPSDLFDTEFGGEGGAA